MDKREFNTNLEVCHSEHYNNSNNSIVIQDEKVTDSNH